MWQQGRESGKGSGELDGRSRSAEVRLVISTVRAVRLNVPAAWKVQQFCTFWYAATLTTRNDARGDLTSAAAPANYETFEDRLTLSFALQKSLEVSSSSFLLFLLIGLYYLFSCNVKLIKRKSAHFDNKVLFRKVIWIILDNQNSTARYLAVFSRISFFALLAPEY